MTGDAFDRLLAGRFGWPDTVDHRSEVDRVVDLCKEHGSVTSVRALDPGQALDLLAAAGYETAGDGPADAILALDGAVGWQLTDDDLLSTLDRARRGLGARGLFLFDVMDGSAVLRQEPRAGFASVTDGGAQLVRAVRAAVDAENSVLGLDVRVWRLDGDRVAGEIRESVSVRLFLPRELDLVLRLGGFELAGTAPLPGAWHRLAVARKT